MRVRISIQLSTIQYQLSIVQSITLAIYTIQLISLFLLPQDLRLSILIDNYRVSLNLSDINRLRYRLDRKPHWVSPRWESRGERRSLFTYISTQTIFYKPLQTLASSCRPFAGGRKPVQTRVAPATTRKYPQNPRKAWNHAFSIVQQYTLVHSSMY